MQDARLTAMIPSLLNTAGEPEQEARSRRANAIEALGVTCAILITLWPLAFAWGVLGHNDFIRHASQIPLALGFLWVFCGSPFWHRDTAESLGLGNPRRLWRMLRDGPPARRLRLILGTGITFDALIYIILTHWREAVRFLHLPHAALHWPTPGIVAFSLLAAAFIVTCLIRYDNFGPAFRAALLVSAGLLLFAGTAAVLHRGWQVFTAIDPEKYALDVIAYVFWGFLQQTFFTAYFGTRLRKAFAPSPDSAIPSAGRARVIAGGALIAAAVLAPPLWLTIRGLYGADAAPLATLLVFSAFALPVGATWTWFYCRDPRRILVATLSGAIFGLIHIDSYGLVLATGGLGTILAWLFMADRTRNLTALGFIHGFLGSTFGKLFKGEGAGMLQVDYRVGPWNVELPAAHVLIVPLLCLAGFAALTAWCWRRLPSAFPIVKTQPPPIGT